MRTLPYDTKERTVNGHRIKVVIAKGEVAGYVDGNQVYGVYVDDPARLRVSTATAPSGPFERSQAYVACMEMVGKVVEEMMATS